MPSCVRQSLRGVTVCDGSGKRLCVSIFDGSASFLADRRNLCLSSSAHDGPRTSIHEKWQRVRFSSSLRTRFDGRIFARQRISSAIQFPIPGKPCCISSTALIGATRCRPRNASKILLIEFARIDFRRGAFPPFGLVGAMMKFNVSELPRIGEHERAGGLIQDKVIILARDEISAIRCAFCRSCRDESRALVFASPGFFGIVVSELEKHLLSASGRL